MQYFTTLLLILISCGLYFLNQKEIRFPVFGGYGGAFWLLTIIGALWCIFGSKRTLKVEQWKEPLTIVAIILGSLILILIVLVLMKFVLHINMPFISSYNQVYIILAVLVILKAVFALLHHQIINR